MHPNRHHAGFVGDAGLRFFYLDRYIGKEEESVLIAEAAESFGDLSVQTAWRKGLDSGRYFMEVCIRDDEGHLLARSVSILGVDRDDQEVGFRVFDSNTVLKGAASPVIDHDGSVRIEIEMASGARVIKPINSL